MVGISSRGLVGFGTRKYVSFQTAMDPVHDVRGSTPTYHSESLFLRDKNVKPAGSDKMYLDKLLIRKALYLLVDEFNKRKVTHNQFCNIFLDLIHAFRDGNGRTCKVLFI